MILGVGVDLCAIERIEKAIGKPRFSERVYTEDERTRMSSVCEARRGEIATGLFAAKEAVAKALGTGFAGFGFSDIEVLPDDAGRPVCRLMNGAATRAEAMAGSTHYSVHVSVSHDAGLATAFAIVETPSGAGGQI